MYLCIHNYTITFLINVMVIIRIFIINRKLTSLVSPHLSVDQQHVFISVRSTAINLVVFFNFLSVTLDNNEQVAVVCTEF